MKTVEFIYNNQRIEFLQKESNIMVNATQMAKVFNKRIDFILKSDNTKAFIRELKFPPNGGNLEPLDDDKIIKTRGRSGTYMHRILALKFAAWLNPKFELWVYSTIDKIIYAQYKNITEATTEKLMIEKERDLMREELLRKHPDVFYKFVELEGRLTKADRKRLKAIRDSTKELKLNLFPEDIAKYKKTDW
jgi:plasmid maintenance system killer protein